MIENTFACDFEQEKRKSYQELLAKDVLLRISEFTNMGGLSIW